MVDTCYLSEGYFLEKKKHILVDYSSVALQQLQQTTGKRELAKQKKTKTTFCQLCERRSKPSPSSKGDTEADAITSSVTRAGVPPFTARPSRDSAWRPSSLPVSWSVGVRAAEQASARSRLSLRSTRAVKIGKSCRLEVRVRLF